MLRLLKILWPALLPLLAYFLYVLWRNRQRKKGRVIAHLPSLKFYSIVVSLLIAIGMFLALGVQQTANNSGQYQPAHLREDGTLERGNLP
jgi:hypothetical protein